MIVSKNSDGTLTFSRVPDQLANFFVKSIESLRIQAEGIEQITPMQFHQMSKESDDATLESMGLQPKDIDRLRKGPDGNPDFDTMVASIKEGFKTFHNEFRHVAREIENARYSIGEIGNISTN